MPWDDGLEGPSRRIAETDSSPLRVRAGPGTGKTFTLIRRVARFLEAGVDPKRTLVCTFTRAAADDLKVELENLDVADASEVRSTTIHSLCYGLLKRDAVLDIVGRIPRMLLDYEVRFLIEDLHDGIFGGVHERKRRLKAFEAAWARLLSDRPGWPNDSVDRKFHARLMDWLKFHRAMLVGELVPEALRYLRNNPAGVSTDYSHVLVDEYQDLNAAEQEFVRTIALGAKITIIGDENQSIYSFKYAHPEGISEFHERHSGTTDETLTLCRRCPTKVVDMANRLISCNPHHEKRELRSPPGREAGEIHVVQWPSMEEEARGLAKFVKRRVEADRVNPGRVLVLAPRRQFGYEVRDRLDELGVPALSFFLEEELDGNPKNSAACKTQEAFTLLRLAANPQDDVALRCWCGFGSSDLRRGVWSRVRESCDGNGLALLPTLEGIREGNIKISHGTHVVKRLGELEARLRQLAPLRGAELLGDLFPEDDPDFTQIRNMATDVGIGANVSDLLDHLLKNITQPELPTDVDYVRIMSLHKSKGLTADLVIVMGCVEGLIPTLYRGPEEKKERKETDRPSQIVAALEEQRRLFYVSITRARQTLILSSIASLPRSLAFKMGVEGRGRGNTNCTVTSRFVDELGPNCPTPVVGSRLLNS